MIRELGGGRELPFSKRSWNGLMDLRRLALLSGVFLMALFKPPGFLADSM
jgi:hypothetical protein